MDIEAPLISALSWTSLVSFVFSFVASVILGIGWWNAIAVAATGSLLVFVIWDMCRLWVKFSRGPEKQTDGNTARTKAALAARSWLQGRLSDAEFARSIPQHSDGDIAELLQAVLSHPPFQDSPVSASRKRFVSQVRRLIREVEEIR
jgi:hypothetical protein